MRHIRSGKKTVAVYSEHYRDRNQTKKEDNCFKRSKQNKMNAIRRPCINSKSKRKIPANKMNKNTANKNIPQVNHQQPSTNPTRTPMELFVEAIRNMQREMAEDTNTASR